ncbi:hypothetical protein SAMN05216349_10725 [Oribacterium sp. KHPX15]|jgi:hypothetical protein|uniref:hypothetical protein n=1 Tax=Oribacterium sp. FC2011 TaxID=1408311 RepID=UPI0004E1D2AA|nr:hypothetical protein [Oribacterium sp. FC2011]SEA22547.1 hypothetical protein SAMN05216349_10725 [Oribacterium sp. KHPX15]
MTGDLYTKKKLEHESLLRQAGQLQLEYIRLGRSEGKREQQRWWITKGNFRKYVNLIHRVQMLDEVLLPYEIEHGIRKINLQEHMKWHYLTF